MRLTAPFLSKLLRATSIEIDATLPRVRASSDEEAIHDLRVAVRRMRVLLKIARRIWIRSQVEAARAGFTKIHRETSALRDEEVLRETLAEAPLATPGFLAFRSARAKLEAKLRGEARQRIRGGALRRPQELLHAMLVLPGARPIALDRFALRVHERLHARVLADLAAPLEDAVALHELRIACKNLRYASELLAPALAPELAHSEKPAARFQKHLGEIHDLDVAAAIVRRSRMLSLSDRATLLAWLSARRAKRAASFATERDTLPLVGAPAPEPATAPSRGGAAPSPPGRSPSRSRTRARSGSPKASRSR